MKTLERHPREDTELKNRPTDIIGAVISTYRPNYGGSKQLWNVGKLTAQRNIQEDNFTLRTSEILTRNVLTVTKSLSRIA
jgi:hypothetical protein